MEFDLVSNATALATLAGPRGGAQVADMAGIALEEILRLPVEERLVLVEQIWDSIAADESMLPLPEAHRTELDRRLDQPSPEPSMTWEEVRARMREQR